MFGSREEKSDLITVIKASQPRRVRIDADFVRTTLFFLFLAACIVYIIVLYYNEPIDIKISIPENIVPAIPKVVYV